jgi:hypothetical protein
VEPSPAECDVICQYKYVIVGVLIGTAAFCLCSAYVIWRLQRYRVKYLENKATLAALEDRARELDETAGGIGIADDEVDMMTNPMVIQMNELSKQLEEVNVQLDTRAEKDELRMQALESDRMRIHAEMERMAAIMNVHQASAPKGPRRVETIAPSLIEAEQRASAAPAHPRVRQSILPSDAVGSEFAQVVAGGGDGSGGGDFESHAHGGASHLSPTPFSPMEIDEETEAAYQQSRHFAAVKPKKKKNDE